ncbi:MAG: hypothetical protein JO278_05320 [Dyella sp.]|nr:hypothetical protein [Dyella sp.]
MRLSQAALAAAVLSACSGITQIQDSIGQFDQATHSASTAQMNFLYAVQAADCTAQFYQGSYDWATGTAKNFDLTGTCQPTVLEDKEIQKRQALMDAIDLYADKMAAIAGSDDDKTLSANAQKVASQLNGLAKQHGLPGGAIAADVEAAVIAISQMALDQRRYRDLKTAATDMAPHLSKVVDTLKKENTAFAAALASKVEGIEPKLRSIIASTHDSRGQMSFFDVVAARQILQGVSPLGSAPLTATSANVASGMNPASVAAQLNGTLDAVVSANDAIAHAGTGGIVAAVNDLVARAKSAQAVQAALSP